MKGRGGELGKLIKGGRKSPFRGFDEYESSEEGGGGKEVLFTYTLAFQCIVNIGVRGSELIRTRVVEAGALDVVVMVLERYLERVSPSTTSSSFTSSTTTSTTRKGTITEILEEEEEEIIASSSSSHGEGHEGHQLKQARQQKRLQKQQLSMDVDPPPAAQSPPPALQYRDEDVLLSLQLLAYLSKYPHVRSVFHSPSTPYPTPPPPNIFSLVETFTHRPPTSDLSSPRHSHEVQYWAGVIMRNACRKDDTKGGIRQCANMACGAWEKSAREFAKCRRCRKAKYCSKGCQSKAWGMGHRYWCAKAGPKEREEVRSSVMVAEGARGRGTAESNDDDDEEDLGPAVTREVDEGGEREDAPGPSSSSSTRIPNHHVGSLLQQLDEDEVAHEMMGGGVFGERVGVADS